MRARFILEKIKPTTCVAAPRAPVRVGSSRERFPAASQVGQSLCPLLFQVFDQGRRGLDTALADPAQPSIHVMYPAEQPVGLVQTLGQTPVGRGKQRIKELTDIPGAAQGAAELVEFVGI